MSKELPPAKERCRGVAVEDLRDVRSNDDVAQILGADLGFGEVLLERMSGA